MSSESVAKDQEEGRKDLTHTSNDQINPLRHVVSEVYASHIKSIRMNQVMRPSFTLTEVQVIP